MSLHTRACDLFGVAYPIVQTGMGWVAGPRLAAATSAAGGLGILAAATMTLPQLVEAIADTRRRTDRPFGVNLRPDQPDLAARVDALVAGRVRVASFAAAPPAGAVRKLKDAGIVTIVTVGARRHAEKMTAAGVDALIAQGHEGGGHTGAIPTAILLPQVIDATDLPVLAAGGFVDGRGLVAALAWGAAGVAMGTRFLLTRESTVPQAVKDVYLGTDVSGTVVTRAVDGVPQRVIRTRLIDTLEARPGRALFSAARHAWNLRHATGSSLPDLLREGWAMRRRQGLGLGQIAKIALAANAPMLTRASMVDGNLDAGILPTGQGVGLIDELPTVAELIERIVAQARATLERLSAA
jgi:NAD(P)H-dependent flavin oxidoreductase YrpB (nitropropane dioxygenase family)